MAEVSSYNKKLGCLDVTAKLFYLNIFKIISQDQDISNTL